MYLMHFSLICYTPSFFGERAESDLAPCVRAAPHLSKTDFVTLSFATPAGNYQIEYTRVIDCKGARNPS